MAAPVLRAARLDDLADLAEIYNHYVQHTPVTFDLEPVSLENRRAWVESHQVDSRHRLLVAEDGLGVVGYATTSRFRIRAAYDTTVEASVYCRPSAVGQGIGRALYTALFEAIAGEDIHRIVGGITLPNARSVALHERFGFRQVGVFSENGRKFDRYWDVGWFERPLKI